MVLLVYIVALATGIVGWIKDSSGGTGYDISVSACAHDELAAVGRMCIHSTGLGLAELIHP